MKDEVIEGFKKDFITIKEKGWVASNRIHDTGIGKTFEDLIGIVENNNSLADYKNVLEIKSSRELSESMVTLFTKTPTFPKKVNTVLREKYGQSDREMKILHTTVSATKFNTFINKYGFKLEVNEKDKKIILQIKYLQTGKLEGIEIYYTFDQLKEIIEKKCVYIAYIGAETKKESGKEFFKFNKAVLLSGLTFEKFIDFVKRALLFMIYVWVCTGVEIKKAKLMTMALALEFSRPTLAKFSIYKNYNHLFSRITIYSSFIVTAWFPFMFVGLFILGILLWGIFLINVFICS